MKRIAIEDVYRMLRERRAINSLALDKIIWTKGGKDIAIDPKVTEAFELTGLNNIDFISSGYYRRTIGGKE